MKGFTGLNIWPGHRVASLIQLLKNSHRALWKLGDDNEINNHDSQTYSGCYKSLCCLLYILAYKSYFLYPETECNLYMGQTKREVIFGII